MSVRSVVVVDDDPTVRELYSRALTKAGYQVRTAATADEALSVIEKEKEWVFFLDIQLPGMDGIELCRRIREKNPMAVTYAVSGKVNEGLVQLPECRKAGFDDYYAKPLDVKTLLNAADQAFEKLRRWRVP